MSEQTLTLHGMQQLNSIGSILPIHNDQQFPIDGRELHSALNVETDYRHWFPRMCEYGFQEGRDFNPVKNDRVQIEGSREVMRTVVDHKLTISMAKEIAMLQRTEKGREIRRYLISVEEAWNSPEMVMNRALQFANKALEDFRIKCAKLEVENQVMAPKAEYFDELVDRNLLTNFRETAKEFGISERQFIRWLLDRKYLYRDAKGKLLPYADRNKGYFEVKECKNDATMWAGTQTLITPKGREAFRLLVKGLQ